MFFAAIKTGRYTHEKRTQDIVEVKTLNGEISPHMLQSASVKRECIKMKSLSDENREMLDQIYSAHKMLFPLWHKVLDSGSNKLVSERYAVSTFIILFKEARGDPGNSVLVT